MKEVDRIGWNRKFIIACASLVIIITAYGLSFVLALLGKEILFTGTHVITGISLVLGLYGGWNVWDKVKGGAG